MCLAARVKVRYVLAPRQPMDSPHAPDTRWYWTAHVLCALAALVALWTVRYLPMVDLPQHAAQIYLWQHYHDPADGIARDHVLNWFTPYLGGYLLVRLAAFVLPLLLAIKLVVTLAALAFPLSLHRLLRETGGDRWWSLLGYPMAFGFSFYWGFLNYLVALPVGMLFLVAALRFAREPTRRRAGAFAAFGLLLCLCHVLVFTVVGAAAGFLVLEGCRSVRGALSRMGPFLPGVLFSAAWVRLTYASVGDVREEGWWNFRPLHRLLELPAMLLGNESDTQAAVVGGLLLLALALSAKLKLAPLRWLAALALVLAHVLGPHRAFGTSFLGERFAVFALPALLLVLTPASSRPWHRVLRMGLTLTTLGWLAVLVLRFQSFDSDARGFDDISARMEPHRRALSLNFLLETPYTFIPSPSFLHFLAWYQTEKGGRVGRSFAEYFPQLVRFRPGMKPRMTHDLDWFPQRFNWKEDGDYDYFVVRAPEDLGPRLFASATEPVRLVARSGVWWLYQREPRTP